MKEMNSTHFNREVSFRPMQLDDIDAIVAIEKESFPTPWTPEAFYNELVNNFFAKYILLEVDGEIAGYGGMWIIRDEAHITNIAIQVKFRGQKLSHDLLREIQSQAIALGAERMTLEVRVSNVIAQRLYEQYGFHGAGVRRGYYTDNKEDALIMWADLPKRGSKDEY